MGDNKKTIILLFSLVLSIYYLRQAELTPTSFFMKAYRMLASQVVTDVCGTYDGYSLFTQSQKDSATSLQNTVTTMRGGTNPLSDLVSGGKFTGSVFVEYLLGLVWGSIIYLAIMFIISILGYKFCCWNMCCMYCLCKPCCKCCKCCKEPKTVKCRTTYLILAITFCVGIFGASIAGVVSAGGLGTGMQKTTCSIITVFDELNTGNTTEKWIGVTPAVDKILSIANKMVGAVTGLSGVSNDVTPLQTPLNNAFNVITQMNSYFPTTLTVARVEPGATPTTYSPSLTQKMGPETDTQTITGSLKAEMQAKNDAITSALNMLNSTIGTLQTTLQPTTDAINSGAQMAQSISGQITTLMTNFGSTLKSVNSISGTATSASQAIFIVSLVVGVVSLASILLVKLCKIKIFNKLTHITWWILGLFSILGFLLSTVLYPVSVVLVEACGVVDNFLNKESYFNNTFANLAVDSTVSETMFTCLYGNGDILARFNIQQQIGYFNTIFQQLSNTTSFFGPGSASLPDSVVLPPWQDAVAKTILGTLPDSSQTTSDLVDLNTVTSSASCTSPTIMDTWVLNSASCSSGTTFTVSGGVTQNVGSATCIGLEIWTASGYTASGRYSSQFSGCSSVNGVSEPTYVQTFVDNFKTNRVTIVNLFTNIQNNLTALAGYNTQFMNAVKNAANPFSSINSTLNSIFADLIDPQTGLLSNAKCTFLGSALRRFKDALCIGVVITLYQIAVCLIVVSAFTLLGTMFIFCWAKRSLVVQDDNNPDHAKHQP